MIQNQIRVAQSIIAHFPDMVTSPESIQHDWVEILEDSIIHELKTIGNKEVATIFLKSRSVQIPHINYYIKRAYK